MWKHSENSVNIKNLAHLKEACRRGKLSHAYIIDGEAGTGRAEFAEYVAMSMLCAEGAGADNSPCGKCPSCIRTMGHNHPDIIRVTHEKERLISVDEVRNQVVEDITVKPYYGPYKIYIIDDAQLLNVNAQNALLKTIEEPPAYGVIFLLTDNADVLLDTIRSRCIRLSMDRLTKTETVRALEEAGITADFISQVYRKNIAEIADEAAALDKTDKNAYIKMIRLWFRDVAVVRLAGTPGMNYTAGTQAQPGNTYYATDRQSGTGNTYYAMASQDAPDLYYATRIDELRQQADRITPEGLGSIFGDIDNAERQLQANVKYDQVFEMLMLNIRSRFKK